MVAHAFTGTASVQKLIAMMSGHGRLLYTGRADKIMESERNVRRFIFTII